MPALKCKTVVTTGQAAQICKVAARTVSKWFDEGLLKGYRIPGSKDRRIPVTILIDFMKESQIPMAYFNDAGYVVVDNIEGAGIYDSAQSTNSEDKVPNCRRLVVLFDEKNTNSKILSQVLTKDHGIPVELVEDGFSLGIEVSRGYPAATIVNIDRPLAKSVLEINKSKGIIPSHRIILTGSDRDEAQRMIDAGLAIGFRTPPIGVHDILPYFKSGK